MLSQTRHNWDDEQVRAIVGNCHRASRAGGSLLVIEYVLPPGPEPFLAHVMDLVMLMAPVPPISKGSLLAPERPMHGNPRGV